jgi:type IV pilus assembly protein PilE
MNTPTRLAASRERGFTLVELLIVVAIIAILAAIATSAYRSQVTKATRASAKSCLTQYGQFMERWYTTRFTYVGASLPSTLACATDSNMAARYAFAVDNLAATTYRVTATPTTAWASRESRCGTLSVDQAGVRSAGTGSAGDIAFCW